MSRLEVDVSGEVGAFRYALNFSSSAQVTALVGPSGAGKSVTLRILAGLLQPSRGRVVLGQRVLLDRDAGVDVPCRARGLGFVLQDGCLFPHLDVAGNLGFGLAGWTTAERERRVAEVAELVELGSKLGARPSELSGGQRQRVALARALAPRPALLLLDEPFAALDPALRGRMRAALRDVLAREGARAVLVTHDAEEADEAGARVRLEEGRMVTMDGDDTPPAAAKSA